MGLTYKKCGKEGHNISDFWKIPCETCGKNGHSQENCWIGMIFKKCGKSGHPE